jgi:hypothetical protein
MPGAFGANQRPSISHKFSVPDGENLSALSALDLGVIGEAKAEPKITVADPSGHEPVTVGIATDHPSARPGDIVEVLVKARIAEGFHIYSANVTNPKSFNTATSVQLALPDSIEPLSDWSVPTARHVGAEWIYTNAVVFRRLLKVRADASAGPLPIKGELRCQACNDELCWPPKDIPISTIINIETPPKGTP